jgi:hypothetical protein
MVEKGFCENLVKNGPPEGLCLMNRPRACLFGGDSKMGSDGGANATFIHVSITF